jgi:hypothetical protein
LESDNFKRQPSARLGFGGLGHLAGLEGRYPIEAATLFAGMRTGAYMPPAEFRVSLAVDAERQAEEEAVRREEAARREQAERAAWHALKRHVLRSDS